MEQAEGAKPLLDVQGLNIAFAKGKKLIQRTEDVHFQVYPGEIVSIVGESGCGKSISALSLLGLLGRQGRVTGGNAMFQGQNLLTMTEKQLDQVRGKEICHDLSGHHVQLEPCVHHWQSDDGAPAAAHEGMSRAEAWKRAVALLDKTGIPHPENAMHKYPHMLSGGMRQRVMIAMALACKPKLLIADEPTTALDVTIQLQIMQLLRHLRDETGMAILLITHDIRPRDGNGGSSRGDVCGARRGGGYDPAGAGIAPHIPIPGALHPRRARLHDPRERRLYSISGTVPEEYQAMTGCRFAPRCPKSAHCPQTNAEREIAPGHVVRCCLAKEGGVKQDA